MLVLSRGVDTDAVLWCRATQRMMTYKPAEHAETTSVAPLVQLFELVHIGDTIQSMVQVYFDKELVHPMSFFFNHYFITFLLGRMATRTNCYVIPKAPHIDRTDFLNGVV